MGSCGGIVKMKQIKCKKSKLTTLQQQYAALEELFSGEFVVCEACKHPRREGKCWNCDVDLEFGRGEYESGELLDVEEGGLLTERKQWWGWGGVGWGGEGWGKRLLTERTQ